MHSILFEIMYHSLASFSDSVLSSRKPSDGNWPSSLYITLVVGARVPVLSGTLSN